MTINIACHIKHRRLFYRFLVSLMVSSMVVLGVLRTMRYHSKVTPQIILSEKEIRNYRTHTRNRGDARVDGVAIVVAMTTRNIRHIAHSTEMQNVLPFFKELMSSFCDTASSGYHYNFYVVYDFTDRLSMQTGIFKSAFQDYCSTYCDRLLTNITLHLVRCPFQGKPAKSQNEGIMQAYLDNNEYFFRANDDTYFLSKYWTKLMISQLTSLQPPNLGVVGPCHWGDWQEILTHEFVHHTHIDIHGFHYPRIFLDWFGDEWITKVYRPSRAIEMDSVCVQHTESFGRRYTPHEARRGLLDNEINRGRELIQRWVDVTTSRPNRIDEKQLILFIVPNEEKSHIFGAIRNAQLARVVYPEWRIRFYLPDVPGYGRLQAKLIALGSEVVRTNFHPIHMWRYLIAWHDQADVILLRDATSRLTERESKAISEWLNSNETELYPFHTFRDHPSHLMETLMPGLFSYKTEHFRNLVNPVMNSTRLLSEETVIQFIWKKGKPQVMEHNGLECQPTTKRTRKMGRRTGLEFIGETFSGTEKSDSYDKVQMYQYQKKYHCNYNQTN